MKSKKTKIKDPFFTEKTSSNEDHKLRVVEAIERFSKRQEGLKKPKRRNKKPEEEVVQALLRFYAENGFFVNRYESKAKYQNGVYRSSGLDYGTPDLLGVDPNGYIHAVEVKAKGRRSTLRDAQREFLLKVIERNGFAYVCDDVEKLEHTYRHWCSLRKDSRRTYLKKLIPSKKESLKDCGF